VHIDLEDMLDTMGKDVHGGLITMGDNNWQEVGGARFGIVDQGPIVDVPIPREWVIGKVVGEIPWLGTVRLWSTGTAPDYLPVNSIAALMFSVSSIAVLPVALWSTAAAVERRRGGGR
jgi:signal peptidase